MGKFSRLARALWEESIAAMSDDSVQRIEEALNGAYQAGVKEEREAIAKMFDEEENWVSRDAIRGRNEES